MYELTERFEQLASYGLSPNAEKEFLQMLVDNPATLSAVPRELQEMVIDAFINGQCRANA